ncbi:MAG: K+/H+ antiporter subunit F [Lysobacteraceae bacterium]|nr:MAG: K+/H+ antiporter subunit F [Xanthomonadaceae bacterium]
MSALAIDGGILAFAIAMLMCLVRLLRGPSPADRVLALDTLYVNAMALLVLFGMREQTDLYFETALVIAMLGFVSTVVLAKFLIRRDIME